MTAFEEEQQASEWQCQHCGWCCEKFPMDPTLVNTHRDKFQRPVRNEILKFHPFTAQLVMIVDTDSSYCVFLKSDNTCAIYEDRPKICRMFGHSEGPLECPNVAPNGRVRSKIGAFFAKRRIAKITSERIALMAEETGVDSRSWWK
jgi:Fe-S-cluster containining protein